MRFKTKLLLPVAVGLMLAVERFAQRKLHRRKMAPKSRNRFGIP